MCLVVLIFPGHGQIGMLLVLDDAFWAVMGTPRESQSWPVRPGIGYGGVQRRATVVGMAAVLCSFPCGTPMPCTAGSSMITSNA